MTRESDGTTTLTASNADQAQLHGVPRACATWARPSPSSAPSAPTSQPDGRGDLRSAAVGLHDPVWQRPTLKAEESESGCELERRLRPPMRGKGD